MDAIAVLEHRAPKIISEATDLVLGFKPAHYNRDALRGRLAQLYDVFLRCFMQRDATRVVAHVETIAGERFADGFELEEVQLAINFLEAVVWRHLAAALPADRFADAIRTVSSILGLAKDALARSYVTLAAGRHAPTVDTAALFRGTDGA